MTPMEDNLSSNISRISSHPPYHSNTTDMWEVAGLLFISSETKEKVETGYAFFRDSLVSHGLNTGGEGPLIFYLDKDFDYISVIETFFPNSYVF